MECTRTDPLFDSGYNSKFWFRISIVFGLGFWSWLFPYWMDPILDQYAGFTLPIADIPRVDIAHNLCKQWVVDDDVLGQKQKQSWLENEWLQSQESIFPLNFLIISLFNFSHCKTKLNKEQVFFTFQTQLSAGLAKYTFINSLCTSCISKTQRKL